MGGTPIWMPWLTVAASLAGGYLSLRTFFAKRSLPHKKVLEVMEEPPKSPTAAELPQPSQPSTQGLEVTEELPKSPTEAELPQPSQPSTQGKAVSPSTSTSDHHRHFDVFISHAGECKKTFAAPLHTLLCRKGLSAFLDVRELKLGSDAYSEMNEAARSANVGVVVLSPDFFRSPWCMWELHILVSRAVNQGMLLIPVFLLVTTDDCKPDAICKEYEPRQGWPAFWEKHGRHIGKDGEGAGEAAWREDIKVAVGRMGVRRDQQDGFYDQIQEKVYKQVLEFLEGLEGGPRQLDNKLDDYVGLRTKVEELRPRLVASDVGCMPASPSSTTVAVLGFEGMGGVGKTTLAAALYDDAAVRRHFGGRVCWVADAVAQERFKEGSAGKAAEHCCKQQAVILKKLFDRQGDCPTTPAEGRNVLRECLKNSNPVSQASVSVEFELKASLSRLKAYRV